MTREDDLRQRLDGVLEKLVDDETIRLVVATALEAKKQARGWCPNCRKAVMVEIDDSKAAISAITELANQAKGRPDVANHEDQERIVFNRLVKMPDADD